MYSEKMLNNPEILRREILTKQKYWFSKKTFAIFAMLFLLVLIAGGAFGPLGFLAGMALFILYWIKKTSIKKDIRKCNWEIGKAKLKPKSERQKKGIAYTTSEQNDELVFTDFIYPDGSILSGNCRIGDFVEGMEFYTVIVRGTTIVYTWPTHR